MKCSASSYAAVWRVQYGQYEGSSEDVGNSTNTTVIGGNGNSTNSSYYAVETPYIFTGEI